MKQRLHCLSSGCGFETFDRRLMKDHSAVLGHFGWGIVMQGPPGPTGQPVHVGEYVIPEYLQAAWRKEHTDLIDFWDPPRLTIRERISLALRRTRR